jgi:hypothetical protein
MHLTYIVDYLMMKEKGKIGGPIGLQRYFIEGRNALSNNMITFALSIPKEKQSRSMGHKRS